MGFIRSWCPHTNLRIEKKNWYMKYTLVLNMQAYYIYNHGVLVRDDDNQATIPKYKPQLPRIMNELGHCHAWDWNSLSCRCGMDNCHLPNLFFNSFESLNSIFILCAMIKDVVWGLYDKLDKAIRGRLSSIAFHPRSSSAYRPQGHIADISALATAMFRNVCP